MAAMTGRPEARLGVNFWIGVAALLGALALHEFSRVDFAVQDAIFDFERGAWAVDGNNAAGRIAFYHAPKALIILVGVGLCGLLAGPRGVRERLGVQRRPLAAAVLTLACVPALVGLGKNLTQVHCPSELKRYGGFATRTTLCGEPPADERTVPRGHCFPAGHASGGYALFGTAWLRGSRRWRRGARAAAVLLGSMMGVYQMLKGAHFLSHTLTTLALAWLVAETWRAVLVPEARNTA